MHTESRYLMCCYHPVSTQAQRNEGNHNYLQHLLHRDFSQTQFEHTNATHREDAKKGSLTISLATVQGTHPWELGVAHYSQLG